MRLKVLAVLVLIAASAVPASAGPALPRVEGPDVPPSHPPDEVVRVLDEERFDGCAGKVVPTREIVVPQGEWDRVIVVLTVRPDGDPWDRLFGVSIGTVEVLRGTTPRTEFTVRRDVTEYSMLLPAGASVPVSLNLGSYVGEQVATLDLEFYAGEPTAALVQPPWGRVTGVFNQGSLTGNLTKLTAEVAFPAEAPTGATVELTVSNHAEEEAQFLSRFFRVYVGGTELAVARAMPYTYAIVGFGTNPNANTPCRGPGTSAVGDAAHPLMWWTAQRALDVLGVHLGVGEIPPFRAQVEEAHLQLLTDARTVEVVQIGGTRVWITSLSFLFDGPS